MTWFRKYPLFATGLAVCALLALGELLFLYERFSTSRDAEKRLQQRKAELAGMEQLTPPPTRAVASAIEADLAKAQAALAAMQAELKGRGPAAERIRSAKVPVARTDAFFDLATYMERMRELAEKNGVEVRPEASRFGFLQHANEGPETDRIEPVFRQRQIAEHLLEALLAGKPRSLVSVKRERPLTKAEREARAAAEAAGTPVDESTVVSEGDSPDFFVVDPRVTARVKGFIDTMAFRITFTGQTASLRNFVVRLAEFELPILVREVEVEPVGGEEAAAFLAESAKPASPEVATDTKAPAAKAAPKAAAPRSPAVSPIVPKSLSRFTVTVELIELVTPAPSAGGDAPAAAPSS
jgi:hypothetical protein